MTLLKPTRRDIVRAATDQTRRNIWKDAENKSKECREVCQQAEDLRNAAAERVSSRQLKKLESLARALNEATEEAGYGSPFSVGATFQPLGGTLSGSNAAGNNVVVQINYNNSVHIKTRAKYPKDTAKINGLVKASHRLSKEANDLRHLASGLEDRDVISGSINASLKGESEAALNILVENIKGIVLDQANFKFNHKAASAAARGVASGK